MTKQPVLIIAALCATLTLELLLVWQYGDLRSLIPALLP
jgi:hypothetical protein